MKKLLIYLVFIAISLVLGYGIHQSYSEVSGIQNEFDELNAKKASILEDSKKLEEDIIYFSNPHNLEKELRSRFNVRKPDEELIIVIPPETD